MWGMWLTCMQKYTHTHTYIYSVLCWRRTVTVTPHLQTHVAPTNVSITTADVFFLLLLYNPKQCHHTRLGVLSLSPRRAVERGVKRWGLWFGADERVRRQMVVYSADIFGTGEKIPEPVRQRVVVSCMSEWVDSPSPAGNAKPVSGRLPRQQAMHGTRAALWEKKRWGARQGALTLLKW